MIAIAGAGAFGTALAIALSRNTTPVLLWARDADQARAMQDSGENARYLPGTPLPKSLIITANADDLAQADVLLAAVPAQKLAPFLADHTAGLQPRAIVACCKGIDLASGRGPSALITTARPDIPAAILTGPSFAADIARGLPTALTLACADGVLCADMQTRLSAPGLRLYRSTDVIGAELGGALKNVIAIACGIVMGAGLGESARAALMTRGFAEMTRLALALGGRPETLSGLSGFGDLVLTCSSPQSRNFSFGLALGQNAQPDMGKTVEGKATAQAVSALARARGIDMPITDMITEILTGKASIAEAMRNLLSRPLKEE